MLNLPSNSDCKITKKLFADTSGAKFWEMDFPSPSQTTVIAVKTAS
jgi:hypothetical protein